MQDNLEDTNWVIKSCISK